MALLWIAGIGPYSPLLNIMDNFVQLPLCPGPLYLETIFVRELLCPGTILPGNHSVWKPILFENHFVQVPFCLGTILSGNLFVWDLLCPGTILSGNDFVPGPGVGIYFVWEMQ